MGVSMQATQRVVGQAVIISLTGELRFRTRKIYQQSLKEAKAKSPRRIVLNLAGVTYIDSAGLGLIALTFGQEKTENIVFGIVGARGSVKGILELAKIHEMMLVCEKEEDVLRLSPPVLAHSV